nr:HAMP domain-containing sensor histidine kinase [Anaerotignum propionicum]
MIYRDKQIRHFFFFLLFFGLLLFLCGGILNAIQAKAIQNLFLSHNNAVATSLLEQGVSEGVVAQAITNTTMSQEGSDLLIKIGVKETTKIELLPFIDSLQKTTGYSMMLMGAFLSIILFGGSIYFFQKRDCLYQQGLQVVSRFTEGDFSCNMPQLEEGTIYRLFTSVEQLSTILQSKSETKHNAKIFLKHTIADISHQLKTPLTALSMYREIISDEPENVDTVKEYSEKMGQALERTEQLILSMLKITRLDAGNIVFERHPYRIIELIEEAIGELTTRAEKEGKNIVLDGSTEATLLCDKQWTREAIENIVKNALDHTCWGGRIHISWECTPIVKRIYIKDNGAGISSQDLHHIFKRFYRSKKSLDTQGVGLGLSMAKSIIEEQGGVLSVQSGLGEGTVFILSFLTEL